MSHVDMVPPRKIPSCKNKQYARVTKCDGQVTDGEMDAPPERPPMKKVSIFDRKAADEMMRRVRRKIEREWKVTPCQSGTAGRVQGDDE
jgi:hypothetical protein